MKCPHCGEQDRKNQRILTYAWNAFNETVLYSVECYSCNKLFDWKVGIKDDKSYHNESGGRVNRA